MKCDLLVIGTGPAASRVARKCADAGWDVAIAEKREFGGTCALRGCNPKKVFVRAAELMDWTRRADGKLIRTSDVHINWQELVRFKREFTDSIPKKSEASYQKQGIATLHGAARFLSEREVQVGDTKVEARHILVATGARPSTLEFAGHEHVVTSDEFMELDELPSRILFIGGGYISFEFAHVAARAGAEVTIVDHGGRMLKHFSFQLVERLALRTADIGIALHVNTNIQSIEDRDGEYRIDAEIAGQPRQLTADLIVHGAGRVPNLDGMDLPAGGVESEKSGVLVDGFMQSVSNPAVYAAGDCAATDQPALTPVANQQARAISQTLLEETPHEPDYGVVPSAVFTVPSLAMVGLTREAADELDISYEVQQGDMSDWSSVKKVAETCAAYEILIEKSSNRIVGAHLLGPQAAETINLFALAMKFDLPAGDLKSVLMTFPTFAADVREMI